MMLPVPTRLLLDTHTFLWWDSDPARLSPLVLSLCRDPAVILFLSLVSLWEIQIKSGLGKLPLPMPLQTLVYEQQKQGLQPPSDRPVASRRLAPRQRRHGLCRLPRFARLVGTYAGSTSTVGGSRMDCGLVAAAMAGTSFKK